MLPLPKAFLAAAAATALGLIAAPAAHATWMTGQNSLPVFSGDRICMDGMDFQWATYMASRTYIPELGQAPPQPSVTMVPKSLPDLVVPSLGVWAVTPAGQPDPNPLVPPSQRTVPYAPILIDPSVLSGWPGPQGMLTHSARFALSFNRWVAVGTQVEIAWGSPLLVGVPSANGHRFTVEDCRVTPSRPALGTINPMPPRLPAR